MQKKILVIGATGTLGKPVAYALKENGFEVRIFTRDLPKAQKIFGPTFEIFAGDVLNAADLAKALEGCYGVHISLPTEVEQAAAEIVARLAAQAHLQRITYISGASVAEENCWFPMVQHKFLAEKAITGSGVDYSIFCPTWVMESLPLFVNQGQASILGKQPCPYHWVAAEDIGKLVSNAFAGGEGHCERCIVHGPQAILMREALQRYCVAFHPEIKDVSSMPFWLVKVLAGITRDPGLKAAGEMMAYFEKIGEGAYQPSSTCRLGAPAMTLDEWMQKKKAWQS